MESIMYFIVFVIVIFWIICLCLTELYFLNFNIRKHPVLIKKIEKSLKDITSDLNICIIKKSDEELNKNFFEKKGKQTENIFIRMI